MNDWELYRVRKSFGNCDDFANFYRYKKDISTFVDIEQVNWKQVCEYCQQQDNLGFLGFGTGGNFPSRGKT